MCAVVLIVVLASDSRAQSIPAPTPAAGKYATVYGEKIYYVEAGSGPVVILLHGLGDNVSVWQAEMGPLSVHFRVIALDQIGFGRSDKQLLE
jgi:2-hydroxy-6-oxonona-2,4-dienedioate hydrolase